MEQTVKDTEDKTNISEKFLYTNLGLEIKSFGEKTGNAEGMKSSILLA